MLGMKLVSCVLVGCLCAANSLAQKTKVIDSPRHRAWDMLLTAAFSKKTSERTNAVRALGLVRENTEARQIAEGALEDRKFEVRQAAATALGQMHATESIPKLEHALSDRKIPVVMAAAEALRELEAYKPAYAVYYDLLTGERKASEGFVAQQLATLRDPKQIAQIGISEGLGFVPFASIGWEAFRRMNKKDPNPVRAVAAKMLAHDPDPTSEHALVKATNDKNWIVRAAAIEAIAERGDPDLLRHIVPKISDKKDRVRYSAAAAVIRLSAIEQNEQSKTAKK
jgi:hypothetical protein